MENQEKEKKVYKITIDKVQKEWPEQFITGAQLKQLAGVPPAYGVWLKLKGQQDKEIGDNETVDLAQPGREIFFTGPKQTTEG